MNIKSLIFSALTVLTPTAASAATLTISNYQAEHFHSGGNVGPDYLATTVENRTDPIPITPGGLVVGTAIDAYAGAIPNVAGVRLGRAATTSATVGLVADDGFFFNSQVTTEAECTQKEGVSFGCRPFMGNQADLSFEFMVDMDSTLYLDGVWFGGNGTESLISVVDFLGLSIREDTGLIFAPRYTVDTNTFNRNEASGVFEGSVSLSAGVNYQFSFSHRAAAHAPDAEGVVVSDTGFLNFAASIVQDNADVAAFTARYEAAASATTAVPLPATGWMLLAGISAIGAMRRGRV